MRRVDLAMTFGMPLKCPERQRCHQSRPVTQQAPLAGGSVENAGRGAAAWLQLGAVGSHSWRSAVLPVRSLPRVAHDCCSGCLWLGRQTQRRRHGADAQSMPSCSSSSSSSCAGDSALGPQRWHHLGPGKHSADACSPSRGHCELECSSAAHLAWGACHATTLVCCRRPLLLCHPHAALQVNLAYSSGLLGVEVLVLALFLQGHLTLSRQASQRLLTLSGGAAVLDTAVQGLLLAVGVPLFGPWYV